MNGVVRATGYTFPPPAGEMGTGEVPFAVMNPAARLKNGANSIQLFGVTADGRLLELTQESS